MAYLDLKSNKEYSKFVLDIQKQIDEADKAPKQKADDKIKAVINNYLGVLATRIAFESNVAKQSSRKGNIAEEERHKLMASIYQSVLACVKLPECS